MRSVTPDLSPQVFVVHESERGLRLDRFLSRRIPRMSRSSVQEAILGRVSISSGASPKPSRQVHPGEVVTIVPRPIPEGMLSRALPAVLHEADGWLIADKPAGIATTPSASRPGDDITTLTGLAPAHRLDRFTSGCLLLTWTPVAARHFERVFREHLARKEYLAIVRGVPARSEFTVDAALAIDVASRVPSKMRAAIAGDDAQHASTAFRVLGSSPGGTASLVRAFPRTGRRHQVRVHLAVAGHPIVGDLLYSGDERDFVRFQLGQPVSGAEGVPPGRHLLHAASLTLPGPDGTEVSARAPMPADFPSWARAAAIP